MTSRLLDDQILRDATNALIAFPSPETSSRDTDEYAVYRRFESLADAAGLEVDEVFWNMTAGEIRQRLRAQRGLT